MIRIRIRLRQRRGPAGRMRRIAVGVLCSVVVALALNPSASAVVISGNGKIAFTSNRGGSQQVYVMDADGSNQVQLTHDMSVSDHASWSADGSKIAVVGQVSSTQQRQVHVMNADGSGRTQLTTPTFVTGYYPGVSGYAPAWSPNGQQIAFVRDNVTIYVVNADGSGHRELNESWNGSMEGPDWSPDGTKVAFNGLGPDKEYGIFVANADGSGQVTRLTARIDTFAAWSPNGTKIAFNRSPLGAAPDIFVMNADGSGVTNVTNTSGVGESAPAWSPDGRKLTFHMPEINNWDIYSINADGTGRTRLTTDAGTDTRPSWQRVGRARLDGARLPEPLLGASSDTACAKQKILTGKFKPGQLLDFQDPARPTC